ncbi:MAG: MBL fold metallo-hydrolase [Bradyrhizobium sp.]|uniref:MBL fold metallo-hydrolase n=1 Tax=Bradyrhizobium sp. TaxID=376 RepID=UPI001D5EF96A|nr:MBL fold metallo-hydrolase [Bradyrhizobium sp.]MBV9561288.1 MBL fold metallo-hydrolase [Bradyrhizobium sp.]
MTRPIPTQQVPGVYHRRVGDILVTALHDGYQDSPMATVKDIPEAEAVRMLKDNLRPAPRRTSANCFLIRNGARTALVDSGFGKVRPTVGFLMDNLAAAGVAPDDIDVVLLTHMHPDHWGGLADKEGRALFPRAELKMHADDHAHWHDDAAMMKVEDLGRRKMFFADGRAQVAPYRERMQLFTGGEVFPGVTTVPLAGHTPGHTGFLIASGNASLLIWGDIVHVQELQVARPEVTMAVDVDPARAVSTRRAILDRVATDRQAIAGMHIHFPAFAHVVRHGDDYRLLPDAWSMDLDGDVAQVAK